MFLKLSPYHMLRRNYFGNPSCILISRCVSLVYDKRLKYIVDFAYYIELLKNKIQVRHISQILITVGINELQVTNYTYMNLAVQMYENHILIEKEGIGMLGNIVAFDYFWRIYRRFNISSVADIEPFFKGPIDIKLIKMISFQSFIPPRLLKIGVLSKLFMSICFLFLSVSGPASKKS
ncbi:MAG: hypothetical protein Q7T76_11675 [Ferruginibacter sp.]|nr:hypothetical protein [Ferruginibacter sp.]